MTSETLETRSQTLHGRGMNNAYALPIDEVEQERLDTQHGMWKRFFGGSGLYPTEANELILRLLKPLNTAQNPSVLDVGSGSGIWSIQMAELFPRASVLGLDLTESKPKYIPANCRFITKDIRSGLGEYKEKFDVIHARCVIGHITDIVEFIKKMCDCLKPSGVIFVSDGNPNVYDADHKEFEPASLDLETDNTNKSWMSLFMSKFLKVMETRVGPREYVGRNLDDLILNEPRLQAVGRKTFFDLLNCPEGNTDLSKSSGLAFAKTVKPAVLGAGIDSETVEKILHNISLEVTGPMKTFSRWDFIWALKQG
ncbi:S-adenosyl-L-methionine-dependent methyltransferase [Schizopora paradoxa]|uniref:S-adenosyl-L-methionine-dependent methyltransferase n=1 Tax=Schizopora paradoxa TaxID=27342 RepID=A0A0H2RLW7_9AGAM|nr:S-adenosyl-L-methionine-dependent methyltransferase [Schizopora paradoxa]